MTDAKVAQQRQLYGEPIGELIRRVIDALGISQAAVARVLGLSPAMLSQLMNGQRVKIGNPLAVARVQRLLALAEEAPRLSPQVVGDRLEQIRESRAQLTTNQFDIQRTDVVKALRRILGAVASDSEREAAARALDEVAPGVAEFVRVYGGGSREEAERHLRSIEHLLDG